MCTQLESELSLFYLDDWGDRSVDDFKHDLEVVEHEVAEIGLQFKGNNQELSVLILPDIANSILPNQNHTS